jgi:hypothetical protein
MSEGARNEWSFAQLRLRPSDEGRPGSDSWNQGRPVPTREATRHRGDLSVNNVLRNEA